jgi:uncharacterized protein (TIGR04255 family)
MTDRDRPKDGDRRHPLLPRKPLLEAILEVHWALQTGPLPGTGRDPHYQLLLGKLFDTIKRDYPYHEDLPAASVPPELTPRVVHHRFRLGPNDWPVVQIGPGVMTVNETQKYVWEDFEQRINQVLLALISSHPKPEELKFEQIMLRFMNTIPLDPAKTNVLEFMSTKMRTVIGLPSTIFADGRIKTSPHDVLSTLVFPCDNPAGAVTFRFATGRRDDAPALFFEIWFVSREADVPAMPHGFAAWAASAHEVVEDSFFRLIEGQLQKEFSENA